MTDPFLSFFVAVFIIFILFFFACHANPIYPEQQLIAFLKIRAPCVNYLQQLYLNLMIHSFLVSD